MEKEKKEVKVTKSNIIVNSIILGVLVIIFICSLLNSFFVIKKEEIKYKEKSDINYEVYLKDNDFYETPYLEEGMAYIASLIDKIDINFNYVFDSNKESDVNFKYKIIARLIIASQNNDKIFYRQEIDLKDEELNTMVDEKKHIIDENISIDYNTYNALANKFRSYYAVNTNNRLEVVLQVQEQAKDTNEYELNNKNETILTIPLSQQEINVGLDKKVVNENNKVDIDAKIVMGKRFYLYCDLIILITIIIMIIRLIKSINKYNQSISNYDKFINKTLRGYDRLIVNVNTKPNIKDYNVVKVESLEELIDLRDNTKEPIRYYVIQEHKESIFFITNHEDLYTYTVKEKDLEK